MIHFGFAGFTCCLGGVALYLLSLDTGRVVKSITRVYNLKDLEQLVQVESKVLPLIIAVSGNVGSETPIKCENSDVLGVFLKKTAEQEFWRRNWKFSWVRDSKFLQPMTKEVPWYLDDGTGRMNVDVSQGELGLALTVGSDVFEKAEPVSFVRATLSCLKGLQILGVRRIEHVVPIGTPLTVVGEAVKDGMGNLRIQKPEQGPFYVSYLPLDQLISKLGGWSRTFKYASMGLTVVGVILLSKPVIEYIRKRIKDTLERRQRSKDALARRRRQLLLNRFVGAPAKRAEPVTRGLERQHENSSGGTSRVVVDAAARRAEPVTRGLESQHENSSGGTRKRQRLWVGSPPTPVKSESPIYIDRDQYEDDDDDLRILCFPPPTSTKSLQKGQSSASATEVFDCEICVESKSIIESFQISGCSHFYCSDCVSKYIAAKLQDNILPIECPVSGCSGRLEPDMCRQILPREVFDRWGDALCEAEVMRSKRIYCPYKDCSALLLLDESETNMKEAECPHCHRMLCAECETMWHPEITCEEFQKLEENERGRDDILLRKMAKSNKWKRCPSCKFYIEKSQGCLYMKCRCGLAFCYNCGTPSRGNTHFCSNCKH